MTTQTVQVPELRHGLVKAFNAGTYKATVLFTGSLMLTVDNIPVARDIAAAEMVVDRKVAVVMWDPSNPTDAVVLAVYT
jgi:hypothetical protein